MPMLEVASRETKGRQVFVQTLRARFSIMPGQEWSSINATKGHLHQTPACAWWKEQVISTYVPNPIEENPAVVCIWTADSVLGAAVIT